MKNTFNIFTKVAAVIAVAFGMCSCLEKMPGDAIPESEGMKTFSDAEQTLTGIYSAYMSGSLLLRTTGDISIGYRQPTPLHPRGGDTLHDCR